MGLMGERLTTLRRAALLHDLGKLAVSNTILDKPGRPTDEEWQSIRQHPFYTVEILRNIRGFERITEIAGAHHERLDGKGYYRGLTAEHLDLDMRILAAADVFDALTAERPYRSALPLNDVYTIMDKDAGLALDVDCIAALKFKHRDELSLSALASQQKMDSLAA
jgi:HD-GYP domain-containing protein (c-di-GMP phosphodiesterase class II)